MGRTIGDDIHEMAMAMSYHSELVYTIEKLIELALKAGVSEKDGTLIQSQRVLTKVKEDYNGANSGGKQPNSVQFRR